MAYNPKSTGRSVEFQRRHFEFIAGIVAQVENSDCRQEIAKLMADNMRRTNPQFRYATFIEACNG